ncbi:e3 ubiquitin-protein ligase hectd2-related [Anaeramoeba flamelloides]|uniref:HECT-type E3 ubiquitin transferase n=1 Tax=Anaeramoeba flamelloides TaxID=1746091 RepID=A0ABQ8X6S0_9EUKA|nr:e3 ubiquitin-protein ligase hectd2-related [Anaeramoeba flamelloides]
MSKKEERKVLKSKIQLWVAKYFQQLKNGCDNIDCQNKYCKSCSSFVYSDLSTPNEFASQAFKLVSIYQDRVLCGIKEMKSSKFRVGKIRKIFDSEERELLLVELIVNVLGTEELDYSFYPLIPKKYKNGPYYYRTLNKNDPGVNIDDVIEAFNLILLVKGEIISESIYPAIEQQIKLLEKDCSNTTSFLFLRKMSILFSFPMLPKKDYINLFQRLIRCYLKLPKNSKIVFIGWCKDYFPKTFLTLLVNSLNQYITYKIFSQKCSVFPPSDELFIAIELLQDIFEINLQRRLKVEINLFYNMAINENFDLKENYIYYAKEKFSYINYPFLLNSGNKASLLSLESRINMEENLNQNILNSFLDLQSFSPYYKIIVRRNNIVGDTINHLDRATKSELHKKLKIVFEGEDGVDEGGVKKEFFQLIVNQLFDRKYGMFVQNEENKETNYWFNKGYIGEISSYQLIGTLLGLAIYNSVILGVRFPMMVYKKLLNQPVFLEDLSDYKPNVQKGLQQLLDFEGNVEETFVLTFQIVYKNVFGENVFVNLKENGDKIPVNNENREEYVQLYIDWELNKSIGDQFKEFQTGFQSVCDSPLFSLVQPEELEALICGDREFDLFDLKTIVKYRDGFDRNSSQVKWFWEITLNWEKEKQRKFLSFCFGTDRVPIGGLIHLRFSIARGGPDSEILPKASTCYGILILPAYSTKEKLQKKLELAIENSEGFGLY